MCFVFHLVFYFSRVLGSLFCMVASYAYFYFGFSSVFHSCAGVCCSVTVLTWWVAPPKMVYSIRFDGAETDCRIAHILGTLLLISY